MPHDRIVKIADQDTNDLEKAKYFGDENGLPCTWAVGIAGRRMDHTIGNIYRAMNLKLNIACADSIFEPICDNIRLRLKKSSDISIFSLDEDNIIKSNGLVWPLDKIRKWRPYTGTLNRTNKIEITITAKKTAYVFYHLKDLYTRQKGVK